MHDVWIREPKVWSAHPMVPGAGVHFRAVLPLLSPTSLSVLWAVCCGAVTSLSPRCHPAGAGFRRARPLPKPHSATSAIHKRQPLLLSSSLAHTASDSHTPPFHSLSLSLPLSPANFFILISLCIPPFAFLWLLPPTTSGFIHAEHHLALPLSLTPSLSLFSPFLSLSTSTGKKSLTHYIFQWEPTKCGGSELGTARHSWSKQH